MARCRNHHHATAARKAVLSSLGLNFAELTGFVVTAFALLGSPGPASLGLAGAGAAYNFKDCRFYLLGIMVGSMLVVVGVAAGVLTAVLAARVLGVI